MMTLALVMVAAFGLAARGQDGAGSQTKPTPYIDDWTHHHVVFSNPGTKEDAIKNGTLEKWQKITSDTRYQLQQSKRSMSARRVLVDSDPGTDWSWQKHWVHRPRGGKPTPSASGITKDWNEVLGGGYSGVSYVAAPTSSNITGGTSNIAIDGQTFTASAPAGETQTGSFSALPTSTSASGPGSITIANGSTNTLTMTTNATGANVIGTFAGIMTTATTAASVSVGGTAITITPTGIGTVTFSGAPSGSQTTTIGSTVYNWHGTCNATEEPCVVHSTTAATNATNLAEAITNTCGSAANCVVAAANASATATASGAVVTIINTSGSTLTFSNTASNTAIVPATGGITAQTSSCSASNVNFIGSATTATEATNLITAINKCTNIWASSPGASEVQINDAALGYTVNTFTTSGGATGVYTWGTVTPGTNGTNTCASPYTSGTFQLNTSGALPTTTTAATYLASEITACNTSSNNATGVTAVPSTSSVTVTADTLGTTGGSSISLASALSNFTWTGASLSGGSDGSTGANSFAYWSGNNYVSAAQLAANIATAVNTNTTTKAVIKATANIPQSGQITFTRLLNTPTGSYSDTITSFGAFTGAWTLANTSVLQATVQPNAAPAMYGASMTTASCANDFVVYPTGQAGGASAATIVAYNNMYVGAGGCETTDPTVYWAYNTDSGYSATTSPILSLDGTQVAFIESNGTTAELVLLKWASSTTESFASPVTPTLVSSGAYYEECASGPCMYRIAFSGSYSDSISAPYYDYNGDALYVGDNSGYLHKFTGVFNGSPAEVTTGGFPAVVSTKELSSPVYDSTSGRVFVGDIGGTLWSVPASNGSSGTVYNTGSLGDAIADAPLVDSSAGTIYVFEGNSSKSYPGYNALFQFTTGFTGYGTPGIKALWTTGAANGGTGYYLYSGMFDNAYFTSANHTGNLWVVANTGVTTGASLYSVAISNSTLGTVTASVTGLTTSGAYPWPSPLTEFYNTNLGKDYVYFSVNRGAPTGCTTTAGNGCILSYSLSGTTATLTGEQNYGAPTGNGCWATGGIVIDNDDTTTVGASQIYFIGLNGAAAGGPNGKTSSNCASSAAQTIDAVQASQSNP
jgi:hypothetical protein